MFKRSLFAFFSVSALFAFFSISALAAPEPAQLQAGAVNTDGLRLRGTPSLEGKIITNAYEGDFVVIYPEVVTNDEGTWQRVCFDNNAGYMSTQYIDIVGDADFEVGYGTITGDSVNFRSAPDIDSDRLKSLKKGEVVKFIGLEGGWFKADVNSSTGYIHPDYVFIEEKVNLKKESASSTTKSSSEKTAAPLTSPEATATQANVVEYAKTFLGAKYKYGTMNGKTFDCSGFTTYVYKKFSISLNRSAAGQVSNGTKVASKAELQAGDLVLFRDPSRNKGAASHVGIYVGNSQFIHASSSSSKGGVKFSSLNDNYYAKYYIGARRVLG